jgi:hypothetical protein|tara:strand:+ start:2475 stop:3359 length:885 start_codon:yes stop_codon:yes gene_type:complete
MSFAGSANFNHNLIRKYIIIFGKMFNDISIERVDSSGTRIQSMKIPLAYGPKQKFIVRTASDPNLDQAVALTLPRMGFEMSSMAYNPEKKLNTLGHSINPSSSDSGKLLRQYNPVAWDLFFTLSIFVKNANDSSAILEQIVPFFTPEWTVSANLIPEMGAAGRYDIPIALQSASSEDVYEGDYDTRRTLVWNLDFIMKGYFFGPVFGPTAIIKTTQVDMTALSANTPMANATRFGRDHRITIIPAMTANGTQSTSTENSVALSEIDADENFGFDVDFDFYTDSLKYNPVTDADE